MPTLPQEDADSGTVKPSKAMVLAGAIEYIRRVERERDEARREVEILKRAVGRGGTGRQEGDGGFWVDG